MYDSHLHPSECIEVCRHGSKNNKHGSKLRLPGLESVRDVNPLADEHLGVLQHLGIYLHQSVVFKR